MISQRILGRLIYAGIALGIVGGTALGVAATLTAAADQPLADRLFEWSAYAVAGLASLLWAQVRQEAKKDRLRYEADRLKAEESLKEHKEQSEAQMRELRAALGKTISTDDFRDHERREENDRVERRQAEASIRDQVKDLGQTVDRKIGDLDTKLDGKLSSIMSNMMGRHNERGGDER